MGAQNLRPSGLSVSKVAKFDCPLENRISYSLALIWLKPRAGMKRLFLLILLTAGLVAPVWADSQADNLQEGRAAIRAGDYDKAVRLLLPLAKDGDAGAQNAVGVLYAYGWGMAQDNRAAVEWFSKAAEQGLAKSQMSLGNMYKQGLGVQRDYAEALKWYRKAAEQGYVGGMVSLGIMYEGGHGVAQNYGEAMTWYRKAAEQGDQIAQNSLGVMFALGRGVQRDYAEAIRWYRKAAEQGNTKAMISLGYMKEVGQGAAPNREEALKWYGMAAKRGHPGAKEKLRALSGATSTKEGPGRVAKDQALGAPPEYLASGYLAVAAYLPMVELARTGAKVTVPDGTIDASNVETYAATYTERLRTYEAAIEQRGYQKIAGTYSADATGACKAAGSMLAPLVAMGMAKEITMTQDGFKVELTQSFSVEGRDGKIAHHGVIVESALVVADAMASDFTFLGNVRQDEIELRPWVAYIQQTFSRYPPGFPPRPNWEALSKCTLTLKMERK